MTIKEYAHKLVDALPDDSPLLRDFTESLRLNRALGEAMDDVREGRTMSAEQFLAKVEARWPKKLSA